MGKYCVTAVPVTYFIGADGTVKKVNLGSGGLRSEKDIERMLDSLD